MTRGMPADANRSRNAPPDPPAWHSNVPYLTADLPGLGGTLKAVPDDFVVEEIPSYEPAGTGDHLFLWIEKRDVPAEALVRHVAQALQVPSGSIGVAGLKDRRAVTRQYVSVPASAAARVPQIDSATIQVLHAKRHGHKLRTGHLRGNRFRIVLRDVPTHACDLAGAVANRIRERGMLNFFGPQRFGRDHETLDMGMRLLRGERLPASVHWSRKRFVRKLALSAAQSHLFNHYLARRLDDQLCYTVLDGDVMFKTSGGIFFVTDRDTEQARFDRRETMHAGPIYGTRTFAAHGAAAAREAATLEACTITPAQLAGFGSLLSGARRHNLVYVDDLAIDTLPHGLEFRFSLPAGSYATVLLGEFMKNEPAIDALGHAHHDTGRTSSTSESE